MVRKSIKTLLRTPKMTFSLVLFLIFTSALLALGGNIISVVKSGSQKLDEVFTTIGVASQVPWDTKRMEYYNAYFKKNEIYYEENYRPEISDSSLLIDEIEYIQTPWQRPYYGAHMKDYVLTRLESRNVDLDGLRDLIVEVTPVEDCTLVDMHLMKIEKIIFGYDSYSNMEIEVVGNDPEDTTMFYKDKKYIMCLMATLAPKEDGTLTDAFTPTMAAATTQYYNGQHVEAEFEFYDEVTEGFYEREEGRRWLELKDALQRQLETIPVLPADSTDSLLAFHKGKAYIEEGTDLSVEEYESGKKVCLVSQAFARYNNLAIGDELELPLYYANYGTIPQKFFYTNSDNWYYDFGLLNKDSKAYPVFSQEKYRIKGLYTAVSGESWEDSMPMNGVVIPAKSVTAKDEDNIIDYGPMLEGNTTFQIQNGTVEEFMQNWQAHGNDQLEFEFYDKGYSLVEGSLKRMEKMAVIFSVVGLIMMVSLVFFFCNIFITKQRERAMIERLLGVSKKGVMISLLTGFLLFSAVSVGIGTGLGTALTGVFQEETRTEAMFDLTYSNINVDEANVYEQIPLTVDVREVLAVPIVTLLFIAVVAAIFARRIVRDSPLEMLGRREDL